jgi:glucose-1-phosphate cytidylyltransferase
MKVLIMAGGLGTRISEETETKPKPMVLINGKPLIWHLMNVFSLQGLRDFVISSGYKSEVIEEWFSNQIILDSQNNKMVIEVFNTGLNTQTGGRISEVLKLLPSQKIIATYGDGLANIPISKLLDFHNQHGRVASVTAVRPPARFGYMKINKSSVTHFGEKNQSDEGWINGGFFVLNPEVIKYIDSIDEPFETGALVRLANESQLMAYQHEGFWQPMDTLRERNELEKLALTDTPPWLGGISN